MVTSTTQVQLAVDVIARHEGHKIEQVGWLWSEVTS